VPGMVIRWHRVEEPISGFVSFLAGCAALANALAAAQVLHERAGLSEEAKFFLGQIRRLEFVFSRDERSRHGLLGVSLPRKQFGSRNRSGWIAVRARVRDDLDNARIRRRE